MNSPVEVNHTGSRSRKGRRIAVWLAGILVVLGLAGAVAVQYLPVIARPVVQAVVADLNVGEVAFTIDRIGWRSAGVTAIMLGDPQGDEPFLSIDAARITYDPFDLLSGTADSLALDGLHVRAGVRDGRDGVVDLGVLAPLVARAGDGEAGGPPPLRRVTLNDARIDIATAQGLVTTMLDGDVQLGGEQSGNTVSFDAVIGGDMATGAARLRGRLGGGLVDMEVEDIALETRHPALGGALTLSGGAVSITRDESGRVEAQARGNATYNPDAGNGVSSVYGEISTNVSFDPATARGEMWLDECVPVSVTFEKDAGFDLGGLSLCPQREAPLVALDMSGDAISMRAAAQVPPVRFAIGDAVRGKAPHLEASASLADDQPLSLVVDLRGGDVTLPGQRIGVREIDGRLTVAAADASGDQPVRLVIDTMAVRDLDAAVRFAPLRVSGDLLLDATGRLSGPVRMATPAGKRLVAGEVRHMLSTGRGNLSFSTGTLTFAKDGLQPHLLVPALSGVVAAVSGDVSTTGTIAWTRGGIAASGARLVIANVGLQASAARFDGVSGTIEFSSLVPVRTSGAQKISIAALDAGVPLSGGIVLVDVRDNGDVIIENAQWPFAGGQLVLVSGALNTGSDVQRAELSAANVDLQQLLTMIDLNGLSGEGQLEGAVPIEIREGSVFVRGAVLAASSGGVLRYSTDTAQAAKDTAEGANIAFQALENFHFEVLSVEIDGPVDGDLTVKVVLQGANPDLLEGYPVHMNITTQGAFMDLMRRGTVGFRALDIVSGKEDLSGVDIQRVGPSPVPATP